MEQPDNDKAVGKAVGKSGAFTKGDPRINRTKPGTGRPPEVWRHQLRSRCTPAQIDNLLEQARAFGNLKLEFQIRQFCAEHAFGRPSQNLEATINQPIAAQIRYPVKRQPGDGAIMIDDAAKPESN